MKIVFMGTPQFAVPILQTLANSKHKVLSAVTQPDRPKGRGHGVVFSPVKDYAISQNIPVMQPEKVRGNEAFKEEITALGADVFVVVAYGQILPQSILDIPALGCVNIHASLLPKYRGAAPMQHAILNGETETGITIMYMDKGMDTGDMILKKTLAIEATDRFEDVHNKMAEISCECIMEALAQIEAGTAARKPQNNEEATYAPMLKKQDGKIDWNRNTNEIINQIRALDPWPGTYTEIDGQILKIWEAIACDEATDKGLIFKTGDGALEVTELQAQGGKRMKTADYLRGRAVKCTKETKQKQ